MSLHPINDNLMIEVQTNKYGLSAEQKGVEYGIVRELSTQIWYMGMHSFVMEESVGNGELLAEVSKAYEGLMGKRVYWTAYAERGSLLKYDGKTFAMLKFTDLIAVEDDDEAKPAVSVETAEVGGVSLN